MPVIDDLQPQYCIGDVIQLNFTPPDGVLTIIDPNGNDADLIAPYTFIAGIEGNYLILYEVSNEWGCSETLNEVTTVALCCPPPEDDTPEIIDNPYELACCHDTDFLIDQNSNGLTMVYDNMAYVVQSTGTWSSGVGNNELETVFGAATDGIIRINTDIIFPRGVTVTLLDIDLRFGSKGRIIIEQGATLQIQMNVVMSGLCNTVWQGIQVVGPGKGNPRMIELDGLPNYGVLQCTGDLRLSEAIIGMAGMRLPLLDVDDMANQIIVEIDPLCTDPNSPYCQTLTPVLLQTATNSDIAVNSSGGVIRTQAGTITACFQSINLSHFNNSPPLGTLWSQIEGTGFNSGALPYPFNVLPGMMPLQSEAGIYGEAYARLRIVNNNSFGNLKYGIRGFYANSWIVQDNSFQNCRVGISAANSPFSTDQFTVTQNTFTYCNFAIQAFGGRVSTNSNHITGLWPNSPDNFGICAVSTRFSIYNDHINNTGAALLLLNNSWETNIAQECVLQDNLVGAWLIGDNIGSFLYCNQFISNVAPWLLQDDTPNSIIGALDDQGDCDPFFPNPADNVFVSTLGLYDIVSVIDDAFTYNYRPGTPELLPSILDSPPPGGGNVIESDECVYTLSGSVSCHTWQEIPEGMIEELEEERQRNYVLFKRYWYYLSEEQDTTAAITLLNSVNTDFAKRLLITWALQTQNYTQAQALRNTLPTTSEEEQRYRQFLDLELELNQSNRTWRQLTSEEEALLRQIAQSQTMAAMDARVALYMGYGEEIYVNLPLFPQVIAESISQLQLQFKNNSSNSKVINVYPNPAYQSIDIDYNLSDSTEAKIVFYNSIGISVYNKNLKSGGKLNIDISSWKSGVYYYNLITNTDVIVSNRLVVIK